MSIEGKAKEAAGFVKEELNEHGKSPEAKERAQEGRDLRNEGVSKTARPPRRPSRAPARRNNYHDPRRGGGLHSRRTGTCAR
jgi:hypothetical protein